MQAIDKPAQGEAVITVLQTAIGELRDVAVALAGLPGDEVPAAGLILRAQRGHGLRGSV